MKLVIAEKPELGRNIAHAVCGAPAGARLPYEDGEWCVVACAGHLLELAEPDALEPGRWGKPWREETLPVLPRPWPMVVAEGKEGLVASISARIGRADVVIHAGDPDDEGQLIVDELLAFLGYEGPVKRVMVNDSIDKNIRRAFERMDDNAAHVAAGRSAKARRLADKCFGYTETRLATIRAGEGTLLSVGRVQTPTLGLIVRRDLEIASHKATEYFTLTATCEGEDGRTFEFEVLPPAGLLTEKRLEDEAAAARIRDALMGAECDGETTVSRKRVAPPLPFNLTELTAALSKSAKMSAKRTMAATQSLRENHRAITYNRSDCPYLPTEAFADAPATLATAAANLDAAWELDFSKMPRCFDDSKIDAHTGVVPQDIAVDVARLTKDERAAYEAICERYAMQFAGDEVFDVSETCASPACGVEGVTLRHRAKQGVEAGWRSVADDGKGQKGYQDGWLEPGRHRLRVTNVKVERKRTKPKRPYTEGTLVKDMANAAKFLKDPGLAEALRRKDAGKPGEHGSIGTTATRPDVIERLKERGFVTEQRGMLLATNLGKRFYDACPPEIRGVDVTARWWLIQEQVVAGEADEYAVAEDVVRVFEGHRATAWAGVSLAAAGKAREVCRCPLCGAQVVDRGQAYKTLTCSTNHWDKAAKRYDRGCGFSVFKEIYGHRLTDAQARDLCEKGRTALIAGLVGKSGKPFKARLTLPDPTAGKVGVEFDDRRGKGGRQ